ncbi:HofP DNA utilization family protein [Klebsiella spallanzanii]|uniref:HofP DNA utilization family protein n=1 Tax=Klebsiella spallanzanii TaxID=2587528 RepID=UPI00111B800D|nr:HofP DNA utilization family protein [Klebsiella spallanzanii]MDM4208177.1 HofP DNA utilization family protein [Klebsiella spallanzanii]
MHRKCWCLLLFSLPLLAKERDPFQPAVDSCRTAQLSQWRYGGAIGEPLALIGLLQDSVGKWRRVRVDETLPTNWRVTHLTAEKMAITTGPGCEPVRWVWQREGMKNDAMDKPAVSAAAPDSRGGKKRSSRVAGRR